MDTRHWDEMRWDEMYRTRDRVFSGNPNGVLVAEAAGLPPGQALDVGCGEGADALWLAGRGWHVTAVDVSETALRRAAVAAVAMDAVAATAVGAMGAAGAAEPGAGAAATEVGGAAATAAGATEAAAATAAGAMGAAATEVGGAVATAAGATEAAAATAAGAMGAAATEVGEAAATASGATEAAAATAAATAVGAMGAAAARGGAAAGTGVGAMEAAVHTATGGTEAATATAAGTAATEGGAAASAAGATDAAAAASAAGDIRRRVAWVRADLGGMALPDRSFELVSVQYFPLRRQPGDVVLRSLLNAVAPGGTLLFATHARADLAPRPEDGFDPADYYQPETIASLLESALLDSTWTVLVNETRPRETPAPAGTHHSRDSVLRAQRLS
jgi:SAM-dependent methyltransferase